MFMCLKCESLSLSQKFPTMLGFNVWYFLLFFSSCISLLFVLSFCELVCMYFQMWWEGEFPFWVSWSLNFSYFIYLHNSEWQNQLVVPYTWPKCFLFFITFSLFKNLYAYYLITELAEPYRLFYSACKVCSKPKKFLSSLVQADNWFGLVNHEQQHSRLEFWEWYMRHQSKETHRVCVSMLPISVKKRTLSHF